MSNISITISNLTEAAAAAVLARLQGTPVDVPAGASAAPAAAPKARTRAKPAEESAPAPAAAAAPAADTANLKKIAISKAVMLINANDALGRNGKQAVTDLCNSFGGKNISAISADKYPAVIAALDKAIAALNEDPAA